MFCSKIYIVETSISAAGMRQALPVMGTLAEKLLEGGEIGFPEEEGYIAQGFRVNVHTKKNGAERAVDMMIKKLRGELYVTELPMPVFDRVKPAPAVKDMAHARIALIKMCIRDSIETVRIITGGNVDSIGEDGTVSVEIAAIMGSCCEMGYEHMTTRCLLYTSRCV